MTQPLRVTSKSQVWLVAGGTAGHLHAAASVAAQIASEAHITLITSDRAIDRAVVADLPYESVIVRGSGIGRSHRVQAVMRNFASLAGNAKTLAALGRPDVVVSFGGFHTPFVAYYGRAKGARVILVEQNAVLGRANRLTGIVATNILAGLPLALPKRWYGRALLTGNQLRQEVLALASTKDPRAQARLDLGIPRDLKVVVVTSGSLGARRINEVTEAAMGEVREKFTENKWRWYHFVGAVNGSSETKAQDEFYVRRGFTPDLYRYLAAADLVVARAGASTVAEICAFGRASILIPLPGAPGDHQSANARVLQEAGAATVIPEDELDVRRLLFEVTTLLDDPARLLGQELGARSLARLDATDVVARQVLADG